MASYVVYGRRAAVAIHRGFACTREELPVELRRAAAEQQLGEMIDWECVRTREAADKIAAAYSIGKLDEYPLTAQEVRWFAEGMRQQANS